MADSPGPRHARSRSARRGSTAAPNYRRRRIVVAVLGVVSIFLVWLAISLGMALTNQSYGSSLSARFAEWGRDHGIGGGGRAEERGGKSGGLRLERHAKGLC